MSAYDLNRVRIKLSHKTNTYELPLNKYFYLLIILILCTNESETNHRTVNNSDIVEYACFPVIDYLKCTARDSSNIDFLLLFNCVFMQKTSDLALSVTPETKGCGKVVKLQKCVFLV